MCKQSTTVTNAERIYWNFWSFNF